MVKHISKKPVFLVGCPRSGTTLLQSLLAAHSQIAGFPESHLFFYLVPETPNRRFLGIASRRVKSRLHKFLGTELNRPEVLSEFSPMTLFMGQYAKKFVKIMDSLTEERRKNLWLEKTPDHVFYVEYIEKFLPGVRFIHIIRNGRDVVASMYELAKKYPKIWGVQSDVDACIDKWMRAVAASQKHLDKPNHIMVKYEDLVGDTQAQLAKLCDFIGVEFEESMLENYGDTANNVSLNNEPWKQDVSRRIEKANSPKFERLFDESERQYILERVGRINLEDSIFKINCVK
ncbi:MAG: sulfotransferase [Cyanobacteriota bacterium]|nr:sulfotransferase [Cyanobacteriota bacterium]